jgi:hypothetical protein
MAKPKWPTVRVHPDANDALKQLIQAVQSEGVVSRVTRDDIASALALYTSRQQAAGMLAAFSRHIAGEDDATDEDGDAPK